MNSSKKIPTGGKAPAGSINNAFGSLHIENLPQAEPTQNRRSANSKPSAPVKLGKVHLHIEKSGRNGKTVTVLSGPGIAALPPEQREDLLKSLKQKFACGGAEVEGKLELQGDERDRIRFFLQLLGFSA